MNKQKSAEDGYPETHLKIRGWAIGLHVALLLGVGIPTLCTYVATSLDQLTAADKAIPLILVICVGYLIVEMMMSITINRSGIELRGPRWKLEWMWDTDVNMGLYDNPYRQGGVMRIPWGEIREIDPWWRGFPEIRIETRKGYVDLPFVVWFGQKRLLGAMRKFVGEKSSPHMRKICN